MLEQALWDEEAAIVLVVLCPLLDDVAQIVNNVLDRFVAVLALLGDNHVVRVGLEGTLHRQVGWLLAHESDEVPVLNC